MKRFSLNIYILLICIVNHINGYSIHENSFDLHENSTTIEVFKIKVIKKSQKSDFPKTIEFHLNVLGQDRKIRLDKVSTRSKRHPISSRDVYRLDVKLNRFVRNTEYDDNDIDHAFYHDRQDLCVSTVYKNEDKSFRLLGTCHLDGHIYTIVPIEFSNDKRKKRSIKQRKLNPHGVVKKSIQHDRVFDYVKRVAETNKLSESLKRKKRQSNTPLNIVIEILLVADFNTYLDHRRITEIKDQKLLTNYMRIYYAHMLNGVNLIYLNSFSDDQELRITVKTKNFIFAYESQESVWSNRENVGVSGYESYKNREVIQADKTLQSFSEYLNSRELKFTYDHAAAISNKDFWSGSESLDAEQRSMVCGLAYLGNVCNEKLKFSINEDLGLFNGLTTVAHELGHNLGSDHDGEGGIYTDCSGDAGFVMSPVSGSGPNSYKFSPCSIKAMKSHLLQDGSVSSHSSCVTTTEDESIPEDSLVKQSYPGRFWTVEDQCKNLYNKQSSFCRHLADDVCSKLWCRQNSESSACTSIGGAVEGTSCGSGKMCIKGACVESAQAPTGNCLLGDEALIQIYSNYPQMPCADYIELRLTQNGENECQKNADVKNRCCLSCKAYESLNGCGNSYSNCDAIKGDCSDPGIRQDCPKSCGLCSLKLTCDSVSNICQNGGNCKNIETDKIHAFECSCAPGYFGKYCENKNPCEPNPCADDKTCSLLGSKGYFCS